MTLPEFDSNEFLELLRKHRKWGTPLPEEALPAPAQAPAAPVEPDAE